MHFVRAYGASLVPAIGTTGLLVAGNLAAHADNLQLDAVVFCSITTLMVALATAYALRARIRVVGDQVTHVGWRGITRFTMAEVSHVQKFRFELASGSSVRLFVIAGVSGRCLLALWGMVWSDDDLDSLIARLRHPRSYWRGYSRYAEVRKMCPSGGLPFFVQHPVWYGVLVTIAGLAVLVGAVALAAYLAQLR